MSHLFRTIIEWGVSLPRKHKNKGFGFTHILEGLGCLLVPGSLFDRSKIGFGFPRGEFYWPERKNIVIQTKMAITWRRHGYLDLVQFQKVRGPHISLQNRENLIWPMLVLGLWARTWLDKLSVLYTVSRDSERVDQHQSLIA